MRIPHTIPKVILRAYARKLDEEQLKKSYEGRSIRSEDATWDADRPPAARSLAETCLDKIVDEYVFYVKLVQELNKSTLGDHESQKKQWEKDRATYVKKKASYDRRKQELEDRQLAIGDDPNYADDDDDDDDDDPTKPTGIAGALGKLKGTEPIEVPETFTEFAAMTNVLDQMWDDDRMQAIEDLDIDYVPFEIAFQTIPDEYYWERCCTDKWDYIHDPDDHGRKWRRMYVERSVWEAIESYHPIEGDLDELLKLIDLVATEVIQIKLNNLIPNCFGTPRKPVEDKIPDADFTPAGAEEDEGYGDGEEDPIEMKKLAKQKALQQKKLDKQKLKEDEARIEKEKLDAEAEAAIERAKLENEDENEEEEEEEEDIEAEIEEEEEEIEDEAENEELENEDEEEEEDGEAEEAEESVPSTELDPTSSDHLDFGLILSKFTSLKILSLVYELQDTGLDFEQRFFIFTDNDCLTLANALAETPSIETFELLRSHLSDEQCKTLIREGLIKMPHIRKINFSYNRLSDKGARAVARLLTDENSRAIHTIHTITLARNKIRNRGGKALAWALTKNRHLTHLDLRCNRMSDPAGRDFGHALAKNSSLLVLLLGANRLTQDTAYVLNKMLFHNTTLKELDLSANDLGKKGGEHIALGIRGNTNILRVDVRLANIGLDFEYDVGTHLRKNRNRINNQYSLVERDDTYPNETESGILAETELDEPEWSEAEEEEVENDDKDEGGEEEEEENEDEETEIRFIKKNPHEMDLSKTAFAT